MNKYKYGYKYWKEQDEESDISFYDIVKFLFYGLAFCYLMWSLRVMQEYWWATKVIY